jgi:hypothetical protein
VLEGYIDAASAIGGEVVEDVGGEVVEDVGGEPLEGGGDLGLVFSIVPLAFSGGLAPSRFDTNKPFENFHTILCVAHMIKAKISACVAAITILDPFLGKLTKIPGVRTKNKTNTYKVIKTFIIMYILCAHFSYQRQIPIYVIIIHAFYYSRRRHLTHSIPHHVMSEPYQ